MAEEVTPHKDEQKMSPSDIYFIPCAGSKDDVNHNITTVCPARQSGEHSPCLQVVEKEGVHFTLDNDRLSEAKRLHSLGQCSSVAVELVPLKNVPQGIQDMLVLPVPVKQKGRLHGRGPLKLLNFLHLDRKSSMTGVCSTDDETDTDTDRSDSECDWTADVK